MGSGGFQWASRLLGREDECAAIDTLLANARAGVGGALVVRGEAGIGKTALLDYARQQAATMAVLSAAGVEAESDLAFAGLHELLRPVLGCLSELPDIQSQALAGALGLAPATYADRLLISATVLGVLAVAAENRPVLCLVDDAQWLDQPSADALVFTARRLRAEHLAILFGAREGEATRFAAAGLPELTLTGLGPDTAAAILAAGARQAAPNVQARLLAEAHGNPLALLELPGGLSAEQLDGLDPLPDAIPLTPRLEGVFRQRISRLPSAAQTALLIAATDNAGEVPVVLRAAASLQLPPGALDPAQHADLIQITGATLTFRHPLIRSALYQAATLTERQQVHAALAGALAGEENTDRRVWHQAMATLTGDEEVAAALEASARRAQLRAGHASAATAFLRAAELSTDDAHRVQRLAAAAQAAWDAGQPARARDIIGRVLPQATGQTRTRLRYLSAVIEARTGSMRECYALLLEAADASTDPSLSLEMLSEASEAASFHLAAWIEVEEGRIVDAGYFGRGYISCTRFGWGSQREVTFQPVSFPDLRATPEITATGARFSQTTGGRTGAPMPRPVSGKPHVRWLAPTVWTTLTLTIGIDESSHGEMTGASAFPRHWVYDHQGQLAAKSALADFGQWMLTARGQHSPWEQEDSQPLVTDAESVLERQLSATIMRDGASPAIRKLATGSLLAEQGQPGDDIYLLLDGMLSVSIDGTQVGELGPGAVIGERAVLEHGHRTATLRAATNCVIATAAKDHIDRDRLASLAKRHHREDARAQHA